MSVLSKALAEKRCIESLNDNNNNNNKIIIIMKWQVTVAGPLPGLRYETVHRQPGPSDAERKLDELTRQLEVEMRLGSSPSTQSLSPAQRSSTVAGVPTKLETQSLQRAKHSDLNAYAPSCGTRFTPVSSSSYFISISIWKQ